MHTVTFKLVKGSNTRYEIHVLNNIRNEREALNWGIKNIAGDWYITQVKLEKL